MPTHPLFYLARDYMLRLRDFLFNVKEMYTNVFLTYLYARLSILLLYYLFVDFNFKTGLMSLSRLF